MQSLPPPNDLDSLLIGDDLSAHGSPDYPPGHEDVASTMLNDPPPLELHLPIFHAPVPMIAVQSPRPFGDQEIRDNDISSLFGPTYDNRAEWSLNSCDSEVFDQPRLPFHPSWSPHTNDDFSESNSSAPSTYPSSSSVSVSPIERRCDNWPSATVDVGVANSPYLPREGGTMLNHSFPSTESLMGPSLFDHSGRTADNHSPIAQPPPMIYESHRGRSEFLAVHTPHGDKVRRSRSRALSSSRSSPYPSALPSPSVASDTSIYTGSPRPSDYDPAYLIVDPTPAIPPFSGITEQQVITPGIRTAAHNRRKNPAPYVCPLCRETFTRKSNLEDHNRIHTGEQPYACPVCNKPFTRCSDMKRHERTHE
ncbi:hypothetical protein JAAARDRAFT_257388 [Jaapia argillacea MUCL 33604]|uniref:C2H2-type domain-containing protein n=1 Tax=Jaapia argillacea MUCL 33604 TaxID=933084 RepID=A0A067Q3Q8_9AGAM|nr:hypothetical protein JAAARDRAFT_257388 [Jaapia argillacea MUCL 33604]